MMDGTRREGRNPDQRFEQPVSGYTEADLTDSMAPKDPPDGSESLVLLERAQRGDESALMQLLEHYQDHILRVARIKLGRGLRGCLDSMDVVQEANAVILPRLKQLDLRDRASFLNWLTKIVTHQVHGLADYHRAQKRDHHRKIGLEVPDDSSAPGIQPVAAATPPPQRALVNEQQEIIDEVMTDLPDHYREILILVNYNQTPLTDVVRQMELTSVAAARQLHRRALIRLWNRARPRLEGTSGLTGPEGAGE